MATGYFTFSLFYRWRALPSYSTFSPIRLLDVPTYTNTQKHGQVVLLLRVISVPPSTAKVSILAPSSSFPFLTVSFQFYKYIETFLLCAIGRCCRCCSCCVGTY